MWTRITKNKNNELIIYCFAAEFINWSMSICSLWWSGIAPVSKRILVPLSSARISISVESGESSSRVYTPSPPVPNTTFCWGSCPHARTAARTCSPGRSRYTLWDRKSTPTATAAAAASVSCWACASCRTGRRNPPLGFPLGVLHRVFGSTQSHPAHRSRCICPRLEVKRTKSGCQSLQGRSSTRFR